MRCMRETRRTRGGVCEELRGAREKGAFGPKLAKSPRTALSIASGATRLARKVFVAYTFHCTACHNKGLHAAVILPRKWSSSFYHCAMFGLRCFFDATEQSQRSDPEGEGGYRPHGRNAAIAAIVSAGEPRARRDKPSFRVIHRGIVRQWPTNRCSNLRCSLQSPELLRGVWTDKTSGHVNVGIRPLLRTTCNATLQALSPATKQFRHHGYVCGASTPAHKCKRAAKQKTMARTYYSI